MLRRLAPALVASLTLVLGACSADDSSTTNDSDQAVADAVDVSDVQAGLAALYAGDHAGQADTDEGDCFATELLVRLDVPALREAGLIDASGTVAAAVPPLDEATATEWVDAQFACSDYVEASTRAFLAQSKGKLDRDTYAACLRRAITDQQLRKAIVATLTGDFTRPEVSALATAQSTCAKTALPRD